MELNKVIVCTFLFCCNLHLIGSFKVPYQQNQDNGDYNYQVSVLFSLKKIFVQNERTKRKFFQLISSLFQAEERDNNEYKWTNKEDNVDTVCCLIFSSTLAMFFFKITFLLHFPACVIPFKVNGLIRDLGLLVRRAPTPIFS